MSLRSTLKRFTPKADIQWLDHTARAEHRKTIKILANIASKLEGGQELLAPEEVLLSTITESKAPDTRMNAAWAAYEKTEMAYIQKLAAMAPHDLTAYHEMMNPNEPPAQHHRLMCNYLMEVEAGKTMTLIITTCPGSAKTTYVSKSFAQWYLGRNPNQRILAVSHALAVDTPIPTPNGFVTMGDLKVGDYVFAEDGTPTRVVSKSDTFHNNPCFRVTTEDGHSVVADENHLWKVTEKAEPTTTKALYMESHTWYIPTGALARSLVANKKRAIVIEPCDSVPTQCIEVDHPSHLYLAGRGYMVTHNTQKWGEDMISKQNRDAMDSDLYRMAFPDVFLSPTDKSGAYWKLDKPFKGQYTSRGVGSGVAGIRSNLTLGDDLYKHAQDALSQTVRDAAWRWWTADVLPRGLPGCPVVLCNTLWHSEDVASSTKALYEEAKRQQKDNPLVVNPINEPFVFLNIPAEAGEDDVLGRKPGEWLWCKEQQEDGFYPISHYEQKRAMMAPSLWASLYLGQPLDKHGDYVSEDDFQFYDVIPVNEKGKVIQFTKTVMSIDTSQSSKERADNTAILVFRVGVDGKHYLVDCWAGVRKLDDLVKIIQKMMVNWEVNHCIMENSGMGVQILENYQGKLYAPFIAYTPAGKGSKDFRFDAAVPNIVSGKVLFPKSAPWLVDLINEFVAFPNGAKDDRVDAFAQYCDTELRVSKGGMKRLSTRL